MKKYLFISILLTSILISCSSCKDETINNTEMSPAIMERKVPDNITKPEVTYITTANAPKVIKAGKPVIIPLKYPNGVVKPSFTNYTTADGLPENSVSSAAIDKYGKIWFSTFSGISSYDGTAFTNYGTDNGMPSQFCHEIFIDSKNKIWVSTFPGLCVFDGKKFTPVLLDSTISDGQYDATAFLEDRDGTVWIALEVSQGVNRNWIYAFKNGHFKRYTTQDSTINNRFNRFVQDKNGNILLGSYGTNYILKDGIFRSYTGIPAKEGKNPAIHFYDSKGDLWFDDKQGNLGKYDGDKITTYPFKEAGGASRLLKMLEDKFGNYWIITNNESLLHFDGHSFNRFTTKDGVPTRVRSMITDRTGNIWLMGQNGVSKMSYSIITNLEKPENGRYDGLAEDSTGNKWTALISSTGRASGTQVVKINQDQIALYSAELKSPQSYLRSLYVDHQGDIWLALIDYSDMENLFGQLVRFDGDTFTFYGKEQGFDMGAFDAIMEDDQHNIWAVGGGGIIKFDGTAFTQYGSNKTFANSYFTAVYQDQRKNYWFGSGDSGVFKFDGHTFTNYNKGDGLPHNFINAITADSSGNIWLATDGGACKFDGTGFTNYRNVEGLSNLVNDIKYDKYNNGLWFATNLGLAFLPDEELKKEKPIFRHYNPQTGFDFPDPRNLFLDKKGVIRSLSFSDIFRFNNVNELESFPVHIRNIRLDNEIVSWEVLNKKGREDSLVLMNETALYFGKQLTAAERQKMRKDFSGVRFDSTNTASLIPANLKIPFKNNNIVFEFAAIAPGFSRSIRYQYMLEGYDKVWSPLSNKTEASFGNMNEGSYTFMVRALNPNGQWSETSYRFRVLHPWYRTWWAYILYALMFLGALRTFSLWRERKLRKEKEELQQKVEERTVDLRKSLDDLRTTQSQLIQSEKMASLGELTAGIAHEIQNPLNFVNNFSEVSNELISELKVETSKVESERDKELEDDLLNDIAQNLEKINHHGKRASNIVKGMLEHSRTSNGQKEPTDINVLCDEYLRLAYHGLRAKDKSFNATMETHFDPKLPKIDIIPQDIGRVLLNLINNAFYAVNERSKNIKAEYQPTVSISTQLTANGQLLIAIKDNGYGIPAHIKDKIFQPFFTTKPTGQGTGLGLSLSYDIVKAHGGELKVESTLNYGTTFSLILPF